MCFSLVDRRGGRGDFLWLYPAMRGSPSRVCRVCVCACTCARKGFVQMCGGAPVVEVDCSGLPPSSLRRDFPSHPLSWDILARRPWVGVAPSTLTGQEEVAACQLCTTGSCVNLVFRIGWCTQLHYIVAEGYVIYVCVV